MGGITPEDQFRTTALEGLLEFGRTVLMALVSFLLTAGVLNSFVVAFYGSHLDPLQVTLITGFLTSLLSGVDKFLHKNGVGLLGNGLTGL